MNLARGYTPEPLRALPSPKVASLPMAHPVGTAPDSAQGTGPLTQTPPGFRHAPQGAFKPSGLISSVGKP